MSQLFIENSWNLKYDDKPDTNVRIGTVDLGNPGLITALPEDEAFTISETTTGLRAVVAKGDQYEGTSDGHPPGDTVEGKDRTEIQSLRHLEYGRQFTFSFKFRVEDNNGGDSATFAQHASPLILFQLHQKSEDDSPTEPFSPPLSLRIGTDGKLDLIAYYDDPDTPGWEQVLNSVFQNYTFSAGEWVGFSLTVTLSGAAEVSGISGFVELYVPSRNNILHNVRTEGRASWKRRTGYHARSRIEAKMRCLKAFGERIAARDPDRQTTEIHIRVALINRFNELGTAEIIRVA